MGIGNCQNPSFRDAKIRYGLSFVASIVILEPKVMLSHHSGAQNNAHEREGRNIKDNM